MIRVVVAEDSATVRKLLVEILESDPDIRVVGEANTGVEAIELAIRLAPDLITMDIHMPVMDGFEATKEIMVHAPTPILIVSSSGSGHEVDLSLDAIRAGALMVLQKPDDPRSARFNGRREELVAMAKAMARVKVVRRWGPRTRGPGQTPRQMPNHTPGGARVRLIAIAASTGGPSALQRIFAALPRDFAVPILVVQHIAAGFAAGLADWLAANCDLRVKVADQGELLAGRTVLIAPDDRHMGVGADARVIVADTPRVGGFRPSGTHLFTSAAKAYGTALVAVILTGMGRDGVDGLLDVKLAGGRVLAQDEGSSVVFGMPGEAVAAGVVDAVLTPDEIAARLTELVWDGIQIDTDRAGH